MSHWNQARLFGPPVSRFTLLHTGDNTGKEGLPIFSNDSANGGTRDETEKEDE